MSITESINAYSGSIIFLWSGYLLSMLFFYCFNYKYRITYSGRTDGTIGKMVKFISRTICILPVALPVAFRGIYTGADTYNYWQGYLRFQNYDFIDAITYDLTSFFYNIIRWIVVRLSGGNVQIFFFLFSFVTLYFVVLAIEAWNLKNGCTALCFFYCCFGPNLMNQMRQMLAVAILLYAYKFAYEKNLKKYCVYAIIAGLFHFSALLSAVIIWMLQKEKKNKLKEYAFYTAMCIGMLCMQHILSLLAIFMESTKYGSLYLENYVGENTAIGFGLILSIIPNVIPVFWLQKKLDRENRFRNTIFMTLPIRLAGYYSYFVQRVMYYFCVESIIALPMALENTKKNKKYVKLVLYVLNVSYFILYYVVAHGDGYFPYTTCFNG